MLKFEFADKVEVGGSAFLLFLNMGFDVRLKINTFDFGQPSFFKNIACAMIVGAGGEEVRGKVHPAN